MRRSSLLPRAVRRLLGASAADPIRVELPSRLLEAIREGPEPLRGDAAGLADAASLRVAAIVPSFRRGSGGHATIANLLRGLEAAGHRCEVWVLDDDGRHESESEGETESLFEEFFGPLAGPVRRDFARWDGADVAVATGWQTVAHVLRLRGTAARAYLVQDHEPEFYPTSAERSWAEWTYEQDLYCVAASRWLASLLRARYGAAANHFDLGIDHERYRPRAGSRRDDLVIFYARAVTPRRAVPLGVLTLQELRRRRPSVDIALFGEARPIAAPFAYHHLGIADADELARLYGEATVGLVLSLTNPSLIPQEMLACGLPCVDVASESMLATYGERGPVRLADANPLALCDALEQLLDDPAARAERSTAGSQWAVTRTWTAAAGQLEASLRAALRAAVRA